MKPSRRTGTDPIAAFLQSHAPVPPPPPGGMEDRIVAAARAQPAHVSAGPGRQPAGLWRRWPAVLGVLAAAATAALVVYHGPSQPVASDTDLDAFVSSNWQAYMGATSDEGEPQVVALLDDGE